MGPGDGSWLAGGGGGRGNLPGAGGFGGVDKGRFCPADVRHSLAAARGGVAGAVDVGVEVLLSVKLRFSLPLPRPLPKDAGVVGGKAGVVEGA